MSKTYFPKVKEAREALAAKALELFDNYMNMIKEAQAAGDYEVANEGYQFLMSHMPKDEDGQTLLEPSVDAKKELAKGSAGPTIQIGIALGSKPKELPQAHVIEVDPDNE